MASGARSGQAPDARKACIGAARRGGRSSAATSAVSAPCSRLPAAKTPRAEVRSARSTRGARVAGSIASPPRRASSWSGDPVAGEDDGVARELLDGAAAQVA